MAASATYTTINGMLFHEDRGGVETFYTSDPLGSLVEARDSSGALTYSAEYWPYGEVQTETGTNPSPWAFVGLLGYLKDLAGLLYVRARHYRPGLTMWQTADPLWPSEFSYLYAIDSPLFYVDVMGTTCISGDSCEDIFGDKIGELPEEIKKKIEECKKKARSPKRLAACVRAILKKWKPNSKDFLKGIFYDYLACIIGSQWGETPPNRNPCKEPVQCVSCCGGHYDACCIKCAMDQGPDLFDIQFGICLTQCRADSIKCLSNCDDGQKEDPWS